jgi:transcriptional regulator GlxA family with amidase domain
LHLAKQPKSIIFFLLAGFLFLYFSSPAVAIVAARRSQGESVARASSALSQPASSERFFTPKQNEKQPASPWCSLSCRFMSLALNN